MMTVEEEIDFNKQMIAGEIARQKRSFFQRAGAVSAFESGPMACVAMNLVTKCGGALEEFLREGGRKSQAKLILMKMLED
jgi:hypothetical protein